MYGQHSCLVEMKIINKNVFDTRQEEGFVGNGYDWNSL